MAPRAGVPRVCRANGLDWQTAAHDSFDPQWLSGALANPIRHLLQAVSADRPIVVGTTSDPSLTFSTPHPLMIFCTRIRETDQIFAHVENKSADMESAMTFRQGVSGNPHGNRHRTRHLLNQEFMQALLLNFRHQGKKAIEKVARDQPAAYLKILALLVPRELKVEQSQGVKAMTDEQLEQAIEAIQAMLEAKIPGDQAKVIDAIPTVPELPAPNTVPDRAFKIRQR
jgi:hypothetical protein